MHNNASIGPTSGSPILIHSQCLNMLLAACEHLHRCIRHKDVHCSIHFIQCTPWSKAHRPGSTLPHFCKLPTRYATPQDYDGMASTSALLSAHIIGLQGKHQPCKCSTQTLKRGHRPLLMASKCLWPVSTKPA